MCKVMITAAKPERLKIVSFLLRLAGWEVQSSNSLAEAVNYVKNADNNDTYFDLLVVTDYHSLATTMEERLFEAQCLESCASLNRSISIVISANQIDPVEKECLKDLAKGELEFCAADHLVSQIEHIHDQISQRQMQMAQQQ
jgi:CheY-like chemotaxis protein